MTNISTESRRGRRRIRRRALWTGVAVTVCAIEAGLFLALSRMTPPVPAPDPPPPMIVALIDPPPPPPEPVPAPEPDVAPAPEDPAPADTAPVIAPPSAPPPPVRPPRLTPPPDVETVALTPAPPALPLLTSAQTAGALTAGSGSGGGIGGSGGGGEGGSGAGCDMLARLQAALRDDARISGLIAATHRDLNASDRAIQIWDGQWLQSPGQAGRGLAGVRQAIALEVAFAPPECRDQPVRGLALITFSDGARLALGAPSWRWRDLLEID